MNKSIKEALKEAVEVSKNNAVFFKTGSGGYADQMPRTMLRYAIEKFSEDQRKAYLTRK